MGRSEVGDVHDSDVDVGVDRLWRVGVNKAVLSPKALVPCHWESEHLARTVNCLKRAAMDIIDIAHDCGRMEMDGKMTMIATCELALPVSQNAWLRGNQPEYTETHRHLVCTRL